MSKENQYPITFIVSVYKTDFSGRSTGEFSHTYKEVANNPDEERTFYESFDGGNNVKISKY
jgi:hypothetical protein